MAEPSRRASLAPAVYYRDPMAALEWLQRAFGFERTMLITDAEGNLAHAELTFGDGYLVVGGEWMDMIRSPASIGGKCTQNISIHLDEDLDAHCARARAAGATILQEPGDQFYGDRTYRALDLEGHLWTIGQTVKAVAREEAEAASGLKIEGWM